MQETKAPPAAPPAAAPPPASDSSVTAPTILKGSLFHTLAAATLDQAMEQDRKHMLAAWKSQPSDKRSPRPTWPQQQTLVTSDAAAAAAAAAAMTKTNAKGE